jgi:hypothetical protein
MVAIMANESGMKRKLAIGETLQELPSSCTRCGGLMVPEFCTDLLNSHGKVGWSLARCIQCGDVVDPVICRNRHLRREGGAVREVEGSVSVPLSVS